MFKVNRKETTMTSLASFSFFYWTYCKSCFSISVVNFEHVIAGTVSSNSILSLTIVKEDVLKTI